MPKLLRVRDLTETEHAEVRRLAYSRTATARLVERARIVWLSAEGWRVAAIAEAARMLNEQRERWLNPEGASEAELKKRTLTNLYNARPAWLELAHAYWSLEPVAKSSPA